MKKHRAELTVGRRGRFGSYREELRRREPRAVNKAFAGGAYGCPGEYFRGAAALDCREDFRVRCRQCWGGSYEGEEWIPPEKRDE